MNNYIFLIIGELIILAILLIAKFYIKYKEKHKIDNILEYIKKETKEKEESKRKIKEFINLKEEESNNE